ncbi:MAG: hypothetical protein EPO02_11150 [Nitrospirae bacterium]|nr:MAG: hypothetical protein EPO02_11150 [Nitrospirota bacterium]
MKVAITTQSEGHDDAVTMVVDTAVHALYRGCATLEDVRARCQEILDSYSVFGGPQVRIVAIKEVTEDS